MDLIEVSPKLVVSDVDQGLLRDVAAQNDFLNDWMAWNDANRPLVLFHSRLPLAELERALLSTTLPPADFLVGAGVFMLVRLGRWHDAEVGERSQGGPWARRQPQQLIEDILAQARLEMSAAASSQSHFPRVQSAALTASGLLVTFGLGEKARRNNSSAVISWILKQLQFEPGEVRSFTTTRHVMSRRTRLTAR